MSTADIVRNPAKKRKKIILLVVLFLFLVAIATITIEYFSIANKLKDILPGNPLDAITKDEPLKTANGRTNFLIFGTSYDDSNPNHTGGYLTDSLIILSVNQTEKTAYTISIPRDLWVNFSTSCNLGNAGKINAVYLCATESYGKTDKAREVLANKIGELAKLRAEKIRKNDVAIKFSHVSKIYKLYKNDREKFAAAIIPRKKLAQKVANDDLTFQISRGESVAILGKNGAGKSTLLKLITGVTFPTHSEIFVNGAVSAILELTAGFDDALTGRENIYLKGMILGFSRAKMRKIEPEIIDFADIGEYIDQPVRTYSSGMKARLGFAINAHIDPDILIIDEALSVGDKDFSEKSRRKIAEIRQREKTTFILVTHSAASAREFCERGLVLANGKLVFDGAVNDAIAFYNQRS